MNEKRLLLLILTILFILLAMTSTVAVISRLQGRMSRFLHENEKLLSRLYSDYLKEDLYEEEIPEEVSGLGFYNFFGEPMDLYGNAPEQFDRRNIMKPRFDREEGTFYFVRDLLDPFTPMLKGGETPELLTRNYISRIERRPREQKERMVRFVYYEVGNSPITALRRRYYLITGAFLAGILLIILYIAMISFRNMRYRSQIESQERLVMLGNAARTLTHEIKNPLSAIRLQSSIIRRSGCGAPEASLRIIEEEVARLAAMTERIGDFLRHPEGSPRLCDLSRELEEILRKRTEEIRRPSREEMPPFSVRIDPERLRSVMDNLINNALESGCAPGEISLTLEAKGHEARITLRDRGRGIPEENLKHIFDPFFTTKSKGSGVGLSIVKNFVEAAGGGLKIRPLPDGGTAAEVTLPEAKEE